MEGAAGEQAAGQKRQAQQAAEVALDQGARLDAHAVEARRQAAPARSRAPHWPNSAARLRSPAISTSQHAPPLRAPAAAPAPRPPWSCRRRPLPVTKSSALHRGRIRSDAARVQGIAAAAAALHQSRETRTDRTETKRRVAFFELCAQTPPRTCEPLNPRDPRPYGAPALWPCRAYVLAIDQGTTGSTAMVFDAAGHGARPRPTRSSRSTTRSRAGWSTMRRRSGRSA